MLEISFSKEKARFELDLQDDVLTKASAMISRMKVLSTFACRAGNVLQSDFWELRIEELESITATAGKRAAAAYAKSFFSVRSVFSSQQQIELNKRARIQALLLIVIARSSIAKDCFHLPRGKGRRVTLLPI